MMRCEKLGDDEPFRRLQLRRRYAGCKAMSLDLSSFEWNYLRAGRP